LASFLGEPKSLGERRDELLVEQREGDIWVRLWVELERLVDAPAGTSTSSVNGASGTLS
jgi:hypothetical protein